MPMFPTISMRQNFGKGNATFHAVCLNSSLISSTNLLQTGRIYIMFFPVTVLVTSGYFMSLSWSGEVEEWQRESAAEVLSCRFEVSDLQRQCGELRGAMVKHGGWPGWSTSIRQASIHQWIPWPACLSAPTL